MCAVTCSSNKKCKMEITEEPSSSGKRKANPLNYKRNVIKKSRVEGKSYTNYKGDNIPSKVMGPPCR